MKHFSKTLFFGVLFLASMVSIQAQTKAVTSDGKEVILYADGSWNYSQSRASRQLSQKGSTTIEKGTTGRRIGIFVRKQLLFVLNDGKLDDIVIYDQQGQATYSYRSGVFKLPAGWKVEQDRGSKRVNKVGPYVFKYQMLSGRLVAVGNCQIEYEMLSGRVDEIGDIDIEYDTMMDRVTEVGDIDIEYDLFTDGVEQVRGYEPGVEIYFMREGQTRI